MSVLVKGMKMPENCFYCEIEECDDYEMICHCPLIYKGYTDEFRRSKRHDKCPLMPIPENHGDLIDRDGLLDGWMDLRNATKYGNKTAEQQHHSYSTLMMYEIADAVDDAPTVIEAEGEE